MMRESIAAAHSPSAGIGWLAKRGSESLVWLMKTVVSWVDGVGDNIKGVGTDVLKIEAMKQFRFLLGSFSEKLGRIREVSWII